MDEKSFIIPSGGFPLLSGLKRSKLMLLSSHDIHIIVHKKNIEILEEYYQREKAQELYHRSVCKLEQSRGARSAFGLVEIAFTS